MIETSVYNLTGEVSGKTNLPEQVFSVKASPKLVHQLVVAEQSNRRNVIAAVKTRGMVRGGGKKPWKQKGTGRARVGSIRSPLWRGGGIIFGPSRDRNFSKKINKSQFRKGLFSVLTDLLTEKKLFVISDFAQSEFKTKSLASSIKSLKSKLGISKGKILVVIPEADFKLERSARNISDAEVTTVSKISPYTLLQYSNVLITQKAVEKLVSTYSVKSAK